MRFLFPCRALYAALWHYMHARGNVRELGMTIFPIATRRRGTCLVGQSFSLQSADEKSWKKKAICTVHQKMAAEPSAHIQGSPPSGDTPLQAHSYTPPVTTTLTDGRGGLRGSQHSSQAGPLRTNSAANQTKNPPFSPLRPHRRTRQPRCCQTVLPAPMGGRPSGARRQRWRPRSGTVEGGGGRWGGRAPAPPSRRSWRGVQGVAIQAGRPRTQVAADVPVRVGVFLRCAAVQVVGTPRAAAAAAGVFPVQALGAPYDGGQQGPRRPGLPSWPPAYSGTAGVMTMRATLSTTCSHRQ